jgi:hypothetical protein
VVEEWVAAVAAAEEWALQAAAGAGIKVERSEPVAFVCAPGAVRKFPTSGA